MTNALNNADVLITANAYKTSKVYGLKPTDGSGDCFFFRSGSGAVRRNSLGMYETVVSNIPRLHYPIGQTCPKWLFEVPRTNTLTNPQLIGGGETPTGWTNLLGSSKTPVASIVCSEVTAYNLVAAGNRQAWYQSQSFTAGTVYCFSVFVESISSGSISVSGLLSVNAAGTSTYMQDGVAISAGTLIAAGSRYTLVFVPSSTGSANAFLGLGVSGNATITANISMPQMEVGTFPTSIILAGSRTEEYLEQQVPSLGGCESMTLFVEAKNLALIGNQDRLIAIRATSDSSNKFITISINSAGYWSFGEFGLGATKLKVSSILATTSSKMIMTITPTKICYFINGSKIGEDAGTFDVTLLDQVYACPSESRGGAFELNMLAVYKTALTDVEAIALTT